MFASISEVVNALGGRARELVITADSLRELAGSTENQSDSVSSRAGDTARHTDDVSSATA